MGLREDMEMASAARREDQVEHHNRYLEASRARLKTIIEKKLRTTFIGDISRFEEHIGRELWGHGKTDSEKTPEQLKWAKLWDKCRKDILTNGNNQIRALQQEVPQYTVEWNRYQTNLPVQKEEGR